MIIVIRLVPLESGVGQKRMDKTIFIIPENNAVAKSAAEKMDNSRRGDSGVIEMTREELLAVREGFVITMIVKYENVS